MLRVISFQSLFYEKHHLSNLFQAVFRGLKTTNIVGKPVDVFVREYPKRIYSSRLFKLARVKSFFLKNKKLVEKFATDVFSGVCIAQTNKQFASSILVRYAEDGTEVTRVIPLFSPRLLKVAVFGGFPSSLRRYKSKLLFFKGKSERRLSKFLKHSFFK